MIELTPLFEVLKGGSDYFNEYAYAKAYVELHDRWQEAFFGLPRESTHSALPWQLRCPTPFANIVAWYDSEEISGSGRNHAHMFVYSNVAYRDVLDGFTITPVNREFGALMEQVVLNGISE
ncbi:hypothetical protein HDU76_011785 [Blyttiomyces sp. JEL0837]|nr:hypothetical protein HDU76_011785 [Blyttiomyces sp. JEL0837]